MHFNSRSFTTWSLRMDGAVIDRAEIDFPDKQKHIWMNPTLRRTSNLIWRNFAYLSMIILKQLNHLHLVMIWVIVLKELSSMHSTQTGRYIAFPGNWNLDPGESVSWRDFYWLDVNYVELFNDNCNWSLSGMCLGVDEVGVDSASVTKTFGHCRKCSIVYMSESQDLSSVSSINEGGGRPASYRWTGWGWGITGSSSRL